MGIGSSTVDRKGPVLSGQFGKKLLVQIGAFVSLAIVCLALWVLYHTLRDIQLAEVLQAFRAIPTVSIVLAIAITLASYIVLTGYDLLALRHIGHPLPYPRIALASFLAYAFGNNMGFSLVTGTSIRYRIYSPLGLSAVEIATVAVLCAGTFAIGTIVILAMAMLLETREVFASLHMPGVFSRVTGIIVLASCLGWLLVTAFRPITIRTRNWSIRLPSARLSLAQLTLAATDLTLVATVLYVLLPIPVETGFLAFLSVFVLGLGSAKE